MARVPVNDLAVAPTTMNPGRALVLVVEDEHLFALDIQMRLSQMGYRARVVHNAADALRELERSDFAVVLMDIRLRGALDGVDAAREIRIAHDIPVIALDNVRSSKRMNRLVSDLLDALALDAAGLLLDVRRHDARALVREACEMFAQQARAQGISLRQSVPSALVCVRCDADRILQVLSNLLANAIKFTHRNGSVTLRATPFADHVRFDVQDSGIGIPEEQIPHVFERFWQAQASRDGTGLGLYIAHGILAAHHVKLAVDSIVGAGTRFSFVLPRVLR